MRYSTAAPILDVLIYFENVSVQFIQLSIDEDISVNLRLLCILLLTVILPLRNTTILAWFL